MNVQAVNMVDENTDVE